ncbi:MAG: biopolymer transporter ExbD [Methylacidiphilales bacterium]|nr:biopolymer transporter ExbD [Candidatus Methylacidiphilales bacterium]MDW8350032.1 biopolymer transporter ExbD [Verrucomicrobiae bacterium]
MKLDRRHKPLSGLIELTPMIDVVLLLLVFFILSSALVAQPGIRVDLPRGLLAAGYRSNEWIITVALEADSKDRREARVLIFFNDQLVTLADLSSKLIEVNPQKENRTLVIKSDRFVPQGVLVDIMNIAIQGGWSVILATRE